MASLDKSTRLKREITAIFFFFLALFIGCCLISYSPYDASFNTVHSSGIKDIANWGGVVGSYLADILFQIIGLTAFIIPITLVVIAWRCFIPSGRVKYLTIAGYCCLILSLSVVFSLFWSEPAITVASFRYELDGGGLVGSKVAGLSLTYLNRPGSIFVFSTLVLVSLIIVTNLSLLKVASGFKKLCRWVVQVAIFVKLLVVKAVTILRKIYGLIIRLFVVLVGWYHQLKTRLTRKTGEELPPELPEHDVLPESREEPPSRRKRRSYQSTREESPGVYSSTKYKTPPLTLLDNFSSKVTRAGKEALKDNARILEKKLADFGVQGEVVDVYPGPVITRYEFEPASGVRISKILGLADDLALALKALGVRILAPVPGKAVVGIEIPNATREMVYFKEIVSKMEFIKASSKLTLALGKDIAGKAIITDLSKMPHLLIAGSTGSGKSVLINSIICSIFFKADPTEVKMLLIDPKRLELSFYEDIPHLLHPVVTDPKKAALALQWAVGEMERRYQKLADKGVRDIDGYNRSIEADMQSWEKEKRETGEEDKQGEYEKLPYILVVIDELADLMMVSSREVEVSIARLAQMARAAGIHLLVATQRPSVDVLTGTIKVNFSARISFQVSSKIDSRTILDTVGAERLLGRGDMLFLPPGTSKLLRVHGSYLSETEIRRITAFLRKQGRPAYDESILAIKAEETIEGDDDYDERYDDAVALVAQSRTASISMIQRRLRIGYNRAARIIERMERENVVGPSDGVKPREVLIKRL